MMGLGYKRAHRDLMHPVHQSVMRRADEDLSDVIILGAILTFGIGTLVWIVLEKPLVVVLEQYAERHIYMPFLKGTIAQFLLFLLFYWALVPARIWPRIAMAVVGALTTLLAGAVGLSAAETPSQLVPYGILFLYSSAVSGLALYQVFKVVRRIPNRPRRN